MVLGSGLLSRICLVAFVQGAAIGAMNARDSRGQQAICGRPVRLGTSVPGLDGIGMVLGYALLGAGSLVFRSQGVLRSGRMRGFPGSWRRFAVFVVLGVAISVDAGAMAQSNLHDRNWGLVFPVLGVAALIGVVAGARARRDDLPFPLTVLFFVAAYLTLGVMFWPYMVPYSLTVAKAAAPDASLGFVFLWRRHCAAGNPYILARRLLHISRQN